MLTTDELRTIFHEIAEKSSLDSDEPKLDVYGFMELEQRLSEMFPPEIDYTNDVGDDAGMTKRRKKAKRTKAKKRTDMTMMIMIMESTTTNTTTWATTTKEGKKRG